MRRILPLVVAAVAWLQLAVPAACLATPLDAGSSHCETVMPADHAGDCLEMRADDGNRGLDRLAPLVGAFSIVRPLSIALALPAEPVAVLAASAAPGHRATGPPPLIEFGRLRI
jgi:hypothetical protein